MKREIKFRSKPFGRKDFVYGSLVFMPWIDNGKGAYFIFFHEKHEPDNIEVDPDTVGQFTGIKDTEGNEIYEGDIVRYESWKHGSHSENPDFTFLYEIIFYMLRWMCHGIGYCVDAKETLLNNDGCIARRITVIGNIHDNPELLIEKGK